MSSLSVNFLDLKNAFGSVAHRLIKDMLAHVKIPDEVISYVMDRYSKLSGVVKTKEWKTAPFSIKRDVFQGDTISTDLLLSF